MEMLQAMVLDGWASVVAIYYSIDRLWLGAGIVGAMLFGMLAVHYLEELGAIWSIVVFLLVAGGLFFAFLHLTQLNPVLFSPDGLARSQVSI